MKTEFYVDLPRLLEYSQATKKRIEVLELELENLRKANIVYHNCLQDKIADEVEEHLRELRKIYMTFEEELNKVAKDAKEAYETYQVYLRSIN